MATERVENCEVNVLASSGGWAWPCALKDIFAPKGISLLIAKGLGEFVSIIEQKRIHTLIIDADVEKMTGLATVKIIRKDYPRLPCILLSSQPDKQMLTAALQLDVFGVINKPVDMNILRNQMNKLFVKRYDSQIFS
jgi:DNA-binding NtrC family response regulator